MTTFIIMYPDLSYVFHALWGTRPDGIGSGIYVYGLTVVLSLFIAGYLFYRELKRRAAWGESFLTRGGQELYSQLVIFGCFSFCSGYLGARLLGWIEHPDFYSEPIRAFKNSGLAIYGGLLAGVLSAYVYGRYHGMRHASLWDAVAPSIAIGYGIGRMACHLSGDGDWGKYHDGRLPSWWIFPESWYSAYYPHNIIRRGELIPDCDFKYCNRLVEPVFPTPLYELMAMILLFIVLRYFSPKWRHQPGRLFALLLLGLGVERFFIEIIRINERYELLGFSLSQAQIVSLIIFIVGMIWSVRLMGYSPRKN